MEFDALVRANIQEVLDAVASGGDARQSTAAPEQRAVAHQQQDGAAGNQDTAVNSSSTMPGLLDARLLDIPQSSDATIRLLKARIKSLEEQLGIALGLIQEKEAALVELQMQLKAADQREAAFSKQQKASEAQVERYKHAAAAARDALAAKEQQIKELGKAGAQAEKGRRAVEQEARARNVRLQRALEEVDKYKQLLQDIKMQGEEVQDVAKSRQVQALGDVKRLERQKGELLAVMRKQAKLIDVLRRQRTHMEAARFLSFTEEEFMHMLDVKAG